MSIRKLLSGAALALLLAGTALADRKADEAAIREALGGVKPGSIQPSPVPGLYEVVVGPHVVYISGDGRYMLQGQLLDMKTRANLTAPRRQQAVRELVAGLERDQMIVFSPDKPRHFVVVFTDIDCGYCRKLHREIDQYLSRGIEVRYLFFPRAGKDSESYRKAVAVWCAKDRKKALTDAKNNRPLDMKTCDNPVDRHMALARQLGLRGTPMIVLDDGRVQPGYVPPAPLARILDSEE